ncbi:MAG: YgdI/YgdR family lipoprotein [Verrucomicrobiaceae bacterium]|jgi:hypothetical protein
MIRRLIICSLAVLLASCGSELWTLELKDGRRLTATSTPQYQRKTGYYKYENQLGRDSMVQAEEVLLITKER